MPGPETDTATLAVILSRLDDIKDDVQNLRSSQESNIDRYVSRGEWSQRNSNVDNRFAGQGREIADLRADVNSKRAPWWTWAALICSGLALVSQYLTI